MKKYIIKCDINEGKIPLIKLVRDLTKCGLREAKDYVEGNMAYFDLCRTESFTVDEAQLGKFLINVWIQSPTAYNIVEIQEIPHPDSYDLTQNLLERRL